MILHGYCVSYCYYTYIVGYSIQRAISRLIICGGTWPYSPIVLKFHILNMDFVTSSIPKFTMTPAIEPHYLTDLGLVKGGTLPQINSIRMDKKQHPFDKSHSILP